MNNHTKWVWEKKGTNKKALEQIHRAPEVILIFSRHLSDTIKLLLICLDLTS